MPALTSLPFVNQEQLRERLKRHDLEDHPLINKALKLANDFHRANMRDDLRPELEGHILHAVDLLLQSYEEEGQKAPAADVAATACHDSLEVEDKKIRAQRQQKLLEELGPEVLDLVEGVTKKPANEFPGTPKEQKKAREMDYDQRIASSPRVHRIKLADRLSNLMSWNVHAEKRLQVATHTEQQLLPLTERFPFFRRELPAALQVWKAAKPRSPIHVQYHPLGAEISPQKFEKVDIVEGRPFHTVRSYRGTGELLLLPDRVRSWNTAAFMRDNWLAAKQKPSRGGWRGNIRVLTTASEPEDRKLLFKPIQRDVTHLHELNMLHYLMKHELQLGFSVEVPLGVYIDHLLDRKFLVVRERPEEPKKISYKELRKMRRKMESIGVVAEPGGFSWKNILTLPGRKYMLVGAWKLGTNDPELAKVHGLRYLGPKK